jgi:hypothetical protein
MTEEELYFYPPNTAGSNCSGYFHRLENEQKEVRVSDRVKVRVRGRGRVKIKAKVRVKSLP